MTLLAIQGSRVLSDCMENGLTQEGICAFFRALLKPQCSPSVGAAAAYQWLSFSKSQKRTSLTLLDGRPLLKGTTGSTLLK